MQGNRLPFAMASFSLDDDVFGYAGQQLCPLFGGGVVRQTAARAVSCNLAGCSLLGGLTAASRACTGRHLYHQDSVLFNRLQVTVKSRKFESERCKSPTSA